MDPEQGFIYQCINVPSLPVALRYVDIRWLNGNRDVVAPTSAPILQMVAIPVQEMDSAPGP